MAQGEIHRTRQVLRDLARWVLPRLLNVDLDGYITAITRARELARSHGLPDSSLLQDAFMGGTADMLELAHAARAFQRTVRRLYHPNERTFDPSAMTHRGRL